MQKHLVNPPLYPVTDQCISIQLTIQCTEISPHCSLIKGCDYSPIQLDFSLSVCILMNWLNPMYGSPFYSFLLTWSFSMLFPHRDQAFSFAFWTKYRFLEFLISKCVGMQMCKVSDWFPIAALCCLWPKASVSNVIVKGEDLCKVTLCNMLNFIYFNMDLNLCSGQVNMQLCGCDCIPGYSISVIFH